jgi:hypothetical protein
MRKLTIAFLTATTSLVLLYVFFSPASATGEADFMTTVSRPDPISIENIAEFLKICPNNDPHYAEIRNDFKIRRNGVLVGDIPCTEPVSNLPLSQYTEELITLQGLRAVYYMDHGKSGHLPWTSGTLYQWMKSKIGGINISDSATYSYCCDQYDGQLYIVVKSSDDFNRDFDRYWRGISGNIGLYAHETRHVDGYGHVTCNGQIGQDQAYKQNDLSAFGIQWWLENSWLNGDIFVGSSCLDSTEAQEIADWHWSSTSGFSSRFCTTKPPQVAMPTLPCGQCAPALPPGQTTYSYAPVDDPVRSRYAYSSKPLGIGPLASGLAHLDIRVALGKRSDPVDIYLVFYFPSLSPEIYLLHADQVLYPLSKGLAAWKYSMTAAVDEYPFGPDLDVRQLPNGLYYLGVLMTAAGDTALSKYFFWTTVFTID